MSSSTQAQSWTDLAETIYAQLRLAGLPDAIRAAIVALIQAAARGGDAESLPSGHARHFRRNDLSFARTGMLPRNAGETLCLMARPQLAKGGVDLPLAPVPPVSCRRFILGDSMRLADAADRK
jgi:hypothetical protein